MSFKGHCTVCRHTQAVKIDEALIAGLSMRALGRRYGLANPLARHQQNHIPATLAKAAQRAVEKREDGLLGSFEGLVQDAHRIKRKAGRPAICPPRWLGSARSRGCLSWPWCISRSRRAGLACAPSWCSRLWGPRRCAG